MAVIKCKMCGGSLDIKEGMTVATCEYCGTEQTLPRLDDDRKANLYDRANHFRRNNDFDKAMGIYETILNEDNTDSEAYWSLVLCRYGIEYVEDPATHKRVPTVNRAQFTSIFDDEDYKAAIKNADALQRGIYEAEAKAINEIQKGILEISAKEEPFDCFISFKETDAQGRRTRDAVLAQDLYNELTKEGFKVFFAPVTLEDKLGTAYEPYIFAALNSSKVMVVLGTKPEHFNAVWVKNEWSRYLALIKGGAKKTLIPAYRDMDPYDLPEEFSHLMAQDMSKLGFMQDLIRGIKKLIGTEEPKQTVKETVAQTVVSGTSAGSQIKRGNMALEDHEWDKADSFFEEALNLDPECAEAYIGKLLAKEKKPGFASWLASQKNMYSSAKITTTDAVHDKEHHVEEMVLAYSAPNYLEATEITKLYEFRTNYNTMSPCRIAQKSDQMKELSENVLLNRAKQYAKGETKTQLEEGLAEIEAVLDERIEIASKADEANIARIEARYAAHIALADEKANQLYKAANEKREADYKSASAAVAAAVDVSALKAAMKSLLALEDYKDSHELAVKCQTKIDGIKVEKLNDTKKKTKKVLTIAGIAAVLVAILAVVFMVVIKPAQEAKAYSEAVSLMNGGKYDEAISAFEAIDGYKDSADQIKACLYKKASSLMGKEQYSDAAEIFERIQDYSDAKTLLYYCLKKNDIGEFIAYIYNENSSAISSAFEKQDYKTLYKILIPYNIVGEDMSITSVDSLFNKIPLGSMEKDDGKTYDYGLYYSKSDALYVDDGDTIVRLDEDVQGVSFKKMDNHIYCYEVCEATLKEALNQEKGDLDYMIQNFSAYGDSGSFNYFIKHKDEFNKLSGSEISTLLKGKSWMCRYAHIVYDEENSSQYHTFNANGTTEGQYSWKVENDCIVLGLKDFSYSEAYEVYDLGNGCYCLYKDGEPNTIIWEQK